MDFQNVNAVGIQISGDSQRIWVCVDAACVLRVKGIKALELQNGRACPDEAATETAQQRDELLAALRKTTNIVEIVAHCVGSWTVKHRELAQEYAAEARAAIANAEKPMP